MTIIVRKKRNPIGKNNRLSRLFRRPEVAEYRIPPTNANSHGIFGFKKTINAPWRYGGIFHKGEKVLEIHVDSPSELKNLRDKIPQLKEQGIIGIYGDTPNPRIRKAFENFFGAKIIKSPLGNRILAKIKYKVNVKKRGYPKEYLTETPKRVVVRFE